MITLVVAFLCIYYCLVGISPKRIPIAKPNSNPPLEIKYEYELWPDGLLSTSKGFWRLPHHENYYFEKGRIWKIDECFEKPNGWKIEASGKRLYEFINNLRREESSSASFSTKLLKRASLFYFQCHDGRVKDLHVCGPGSTLEGQDCVSINPCTDLSDGEVFADTMDSHYYYKCRRGQLDRKKCPFNRVFYSDSCRSVNDFEDQCRDSNFFFKLDGEKYILCRAGKPTLFKCRKGTQFFEESGTCESDLCIGKENGKFALPLKRTGPFFYSPGYFVCENGHVNEEVKCPDEWDDYSVGERFKDMPSVFDGRTETCTAPSFCENVRPEFPGKTIVPVYEMFKYAREWHASLLYDNAVGYRCDANGRKTRVAVRPGNRIDDFEEVSACDKNRVVVGDETDRYYDCEKGVEVFCPPDTFFDGNECRAKSSTAHTIRGMDILEFDGLSKFNGWMVPPTYSKDPVPECTEPESKYLIGYNVCAHPECELYPFLKQVDFRIIGFDGNFYCEYNKGGKIVRKRNFRLKNQLFYYWDQRMGIEGFKNDAECIPGQRTKTGYFELDSALYATCEPRQPFVFCPSPYTKGIGLTPNGNYACVPSDRARRGIVPADTEAKFFAPEIEAFFPVNGATYSLNGEEKIYDANVNPRGISVANFGNQIVSMKSEKAININFHILISYPINSYVLAGSLRSSQNKHRNYILKGRGWTDKPLTVTEYDCKIDRLKQVI